MNKPRVEVWCPSYDMLYGKSKLGFIPKIGTLAKVTDKYIIQGGYVDRDGHGNYWTMREDSVGDAYAVTYDGGTYPYAVVNRNTGCRLVSTLSSILKNCVERVKVEQGSDGISRFYFGHDWSDAVSRPMQQELEELYKAGKLTLSNKTFTSDACTLSECSKSFVPLKEKVYEYQGEFYVRSIGRFWKNYAILSNSAYYENGDAIWCKVVPLRWLYDEKTDICMMEKLTFAGVQFNRTRNYQAANYDNTDMKMYLDTYYVPEIMQFTNITISENPKEDASILPQLHTEKISVNNLRVGDYVLFNNDIWSVIEHQPKAVLIRNSQNVAMSIPVNFTENISKVVIK